MDAFDGSMCSEAPVFGKSLIQGSVRGASLLHCLLQLIRGGRLTDTHLFLPALLSPTMSTTLLSKHILVVVFALAVCAGLPPVTLQDGVWPATCNATAANDVCTGVCRVGYVPSVPATISCVANGSSPTGGSWAPAINSGCSTTKSEWSALLLVCGYVLLGCNSKWACAPC